MRQTYQITRQAIRNWWRDIARRGHLIVAIFAIGLILAFIVIALSTYWAFQTKQDYRNKIEQNSERIKGLERQKQDK